MRIDILDPGLCFAAGHHAEWNLRLARGLKARGHEFRIYAHTEVAPEIIARFAPYAEVVPKFRISPYLRPVLFQQPPASEIPAFDPVAGQVAHFVDGARYLAEDLGSLSPAELRIWPTFMAYQAYALTLTGERERNVGCIHNEASYCGASGASFWRYAWLQARSQKVPLRLVTTTPELRAEYEALLPDEPVETIPLCIESRPPAVPRSRPTRLGFFGEQRGEKGVTLLQEIVPRLLNDGWEVVVHDSGGFVRGESNGRLVVLGYVEDLTCEIERCDLVVAPYNASAYRSRGSGIVWEALACGVPVIVPAASSPGRLVASLGAGVGIETTDGPTIGRAISAAVTNYAKISENAFRASRRWSESNGASRFVDAVVRQA